MIMPILMMTVGVWWWLWEGCCFDDDEGEKEDNTVGSDSFSVIMFSIVMFMAG